MIMTVIITIVTGVLLGLAKSVRTPTDSLEDLTRNIVVGMAGAFVGLRVTGTIYDSAETGASAIALTIAAISGAATLLFIVNRARRA